MEGVVAKRCLRQSSINKNQYNIKNVSRKDTYNSVYNKNILELFGFSPLGYLKVPAFYLIPQIPKKNKSWVLKKSMVCLGKSLWSMICSKMIY